MGDRLAEKMISLWWSKSAAPLSHACSEWIEDSCLNPGPFWEDLFVLHQKSKRNPAGSLLGVQYDFYHDCIVRHLSSNPIAFTHVKKSEVENWTYKDVHQCVNYHIGKWEKYDLQPNQLAVLAIAPGIAFIIALFASLRLGLRICFLPLDTDVLAHRFVEKVLGEAAPQFMITDQDRGLKHSALQLIIETAGRNEENHAPLSFAYPASNVVQTTLALHRQEALAFVPLDAQTMYLHAMRDYIMGFNLIENISWAAPLSCPLRTEPCSTLASHLAGARKFEVCAKDLKENPLLLKNEKIYLLGVCPALQELWTRNPGAPSYLEAWYKAPFDMNYSAWKAFVHANKLEKASFYHLLMDNSMGGAILFSRPQIEAYDIFMKCSPGTAWSLKDIEGSPINATPGFGLYSAELALDHNNQMESNFILSDFQRNCTLTGPQLPCRDGFTFPLAELENLVGSLSFVEACMVLPVVKTGQSFDSQFVLLVFVNPMRREGFEQDKSAWKREIVQLVKDHLGTAYMADQIEFFPLIPKKRDSGVDRAWCARQYASGSLGKKVESPAYQILHILKKLASDPKNVSPS